MNLNEEVRPEVYFYLANGTIIKSIFELISNLKKIKEEVYAHHVNTDKNDFANWIKDIYSDEALASKVTLTKNKKALIKTLEQALKENTKKIKEEEKIRKLEEKKRDLELKKGVKIIETPKKKSEIMKLLKV